MHPARRPNALGRGDRAAGATSHDRPLPGGAGPATVVVAGPVTAPAEHSLSAGRAERPAGPALSPNGAAAAGIDGAGMMDGGVAPAN